MNFIETPAALGMAVVACKFASINLSNSRSRTRKWDQDRCRWHSETGSAWRCGTKRISSVSLPQCRAHRLRNRIRRSKSRPNSSPQRPQGQTLSVIGETRRRTNYVPGQGIASSSAPSGVGEVWEKKAPLPIVSLTFHTFSKFIPTRTSRRPPACSLRAYPSLREMLGWTPMDGTPLCGPEGSSRLNINRRTKAA